MFFKCHYDEQSGFTLIEIITTIVILGVAATAIMSVFSATVRTSANPMIQQQAISIAEAYMEEIMLKSFNDPDGTEVGESRSSFDDIDDYDGLTDNGVRDQNNNPIASLADYTVTVTVANSSLNGIAVADAFLITVNVAHSVLGSTALNGYRTSY
ncbi:MAG: type II secretion system protein [Gammaproteobacteria bacterium]|nr:type II secretion system protein [Gammaproteobacteria bacterium]